MARVQAKQLLADLHLETVASLQMVTPQEWNALGIEDDPFLNHAFLVALERNNCAGEEFGWYPQHLLVRDNTGLLIGAMPMYGKTNSYGEFVFDWSWAEAYQRAGRAYYPKFVVSLPFTPATGVRLLVRPGSPSRLIKDLLIDYAVKLAQQNGYSSIHWLFTAIQDAHALQAHCMILRQGCQYHWHNHGYRDFADFVSTFTARKRKKLLRERRRVGEQGIELQMVTGHEADDETWETVYRFYLATYERKWGMPTLNLEFFKEIAHSMGKRIVLILAKLNGNLIATAVSFRSDTVLYGRIWGCRHAYHSLHFEACYYQGIEYCISHGLKRFEPGAQGEHKIARGFLPVPTWSAHWIRDPDFQPVIAEFCARERRFMRQQYQQLNALAPYKRGFAPPMTPPFL